MIGTRILHQHPDRERTKVCRRASFDPHHQLRRTERKNTHTVIRTCD